MEEDRALMLLRVQLFGAMQTLKGEKLREFWGLIDEIMGSRSLFPPYDEPSTATLEEAERDV
jgi:hypothetical protein